jgi:hypothetical protein
LYFPSQFQFPLCFPFAVAQTRTGRLASDGYGRTSREQNAVLERRLMSILDGKCVLDDVRRQEAKAPLYISEILTNICTVEIENYTCLHFSYKKGFEG